MPHPPRAKDVLKQTAGSPRLLVSRRALLHNVRQLRKAAGPGVRFCAVVKADAYGHSAGLVVDTLGNFPADAPPAADPVPKPLAPTVAGGAAPAPVAPAADAFAVATIAEALALPDVELPTMVLRPTECIYLGDNRAQIEAALRRGLLLSVITPAAADDLARIAQRLGVRANVQVMLDTGMAREGCDPRHVGPVLAAIARHGALRLAGLGTHFTDSELDDEPYTDEQLRHFHELVDPYLATLPGGGAGILRHVSNSGGTLMAEDAAEDMVRCGISLYGVDPTCRPSVQRPLRPVARLTAPLLYVRDVSAGASVGYNRLWRAPRDTRVGLIPVGYADGYPRCLGGKAVVRLRAPVGREGAGLDLRPEQRDAFCPVVGRVSMDYVTIDLSPAPWAQQGDEVVLMDDDPASPCSAYRLAEQSGTIPYELFTGLGPRLRRVAVEPSDTELDAEEAD